MRKDKTTEANSMKICTVLGTRPEIIRLSLIIKFLDIHAERHIIVHTGQNFSKELNHVFFNQLNIREPDYVLFNAQQSFGEQLATMFKELEKIFLRENPDRVLVLGDTNSALSSILAEQMNIPVVHMEAGNRCFDWEVPEEKNRKMIDSISTFNLPYTERSKVHLIQEGFPINRIFVTGNPIYEVLQHFQSNITKSRILEDLKLEKRNYFLVTFHRAENVDHPERLKEIIKGLNLVGNYFEKRMICSIHPRTQSKISEELEVNLSPYVEFYKPFSFFDFVNLEQHASCVLTDSGTVQEECCIFQVPTVTLRRTTERPETIEVGSNILSGIDSESILEKTKIMVRQPGGWKCPDGYTDSNVAGRVVKFVLGGVNSV